MIFRHFLLKDVNEVNVFLVACEETREAAFIDIGGFTKEMSEFVQENDLKLDKIFLTHSHYDHVDGLAPAVERFGAHVFGAMDEMNGVHVMRKGHGDTVEVGKLSAKIVSTPGHTPDGLSLIFPTMIFSGDALFAGAVGGTAGPENAKQQIDHIREHLFSQPDHLEIHVGHGPSTTVGIERRCNPFFV